MTLSQIHPLSFPNNFPGDCFNLECSFEFPGLHQKFFYIDNLNIKNNYILVTLNTVAAILCSANGVKYV